ncbi:unnamed protein product [Camellia sinensis]
MGRESSLWVGIGAVRIGVSLQVEEAAIADIVVAENGAVEAGGRVRRRGVVRRWLVQGERDVSGGDEAAGGGGEVDDGSEVVLVESRLKAVVLKGVQSKMVPGLVEIELSHLFRIVLYRLLEQNKSRSVGFDG